VTWLSSSGRFGNFTGQWAPTLTSHDPNPPITLESPPLAADEGMPTNSAMSGDVCVEGYAQTVEYYATDDIQGVQCNPLHDFELPPDESVLNTSIPDYIPDEMFEPGEFWFQTGPPTSADDETGQTRGQTCLPDYLEPDAEIDPSDADWQNPTTLNDAVCTFPMYKAQARTETVSGTTHTATLPSYAAGDGVLLLVATSDVEVLTPPSGWGVVFQRSSTDLTTNLTIAAYWRVMGGTEGATVDVTSATAATLTFQAFSFTQVDPYTGPDSATNVTTGANDNPPSLTHDWPDQKTMWVMLDFGPDNTHTITNVPLVYRNWGLFGFPTGGANQYVMAGLRQLEAATDDPNAFTGAITSSATATIAIRGYCADDLNSDPAGQSVPAELEPEAEVDCYGWQSQGPCDDPSSVVVDDLLTVTSIPDWLEPEAEPNPEDIGSGGWSQGATDDGTICYFPVIESTATFEAVTGAATHSVTMPSGVVAGDKLIMFVWVGTSTLTPPSGWTRISTSATGEAQVFVKTADGTEGATENVTIGVSEDLAAITYRISTPYVGNDWYAIAQENVNDALNPPLTHGFADRQVVWIVAKLLSNNQKTDPPTGFTGIITADSGSVGNPPWGATAHKYDVATSITPDDWNSAKCETAFTVAVRGVCVGEDFTPGSQWTAVTEPPEDVFEEAPEWVKTPQQDFAGDDDPAPHYFPDDLEPEAEVDAFGWQQSVTVEDFPLDPEIPLTSVPTDLEPEAEVDSEGWHSSPLHDFPDNADINTRSVPDDLEPEAEVGTEGWQSEPLHDTPSTADVTGTSVPDTVLSDDLVDCDGWAFRLPDMEAAAPVAQPDPGVSVGTLPGVRPRRKWWVENISAEEKKRKKIHGTRWPDLPDVDVPRRWEPRVVTDKTVRPRLDAAQRDWKNKIRKARRADDEIIMAIIAVLLAEDRDD